MRFVGHCLLVLLCLCSESYLQIAFLADSACRHHCGFLFTVGVEVHEKLREREGGHRLCVCFSGLILCDGVFDQRCFW